MAASPARSRRALASAVGSRGRTTSAIGNDRAQAKQLTQPGSSTSSCMSPPQTGHACKYQFIGSSSVGEHHGQRSPPYAEDYVVERMANPHHADSSRHAMRWSRRCIANRKCHAEPPDGAWGAHCVTTYPRNCEIGEREEPCKRSRLRFLHERFRACAPP